MRAVDLIRKKRDAGEHTREEIDFLISNYTRGVIPDYQMASWLMASWLRGLSHATNYPITMACCKRVSVRYAPRATQHSQ